MTYTIELEREADGRWIAEVPDLPGVLSYGANCEQAVKRVQALALRVIAEGLTTRRLDHGCWPGSLDGPA
jgi:predicted RNase H-like HicB family nuclease